MSDDLPDPESPGRAAHRRGAHRGTPDGHADARDRRPTSAGWLAGRRRRGVGQPDDARHPPRTARRRAARRRARRRRILGRRRAPEEPRRRHGTGALAGLAARFRSAAGAGATGAAGAAASRFGGLFGGAPPPRTTGTISVVNGDTLYVDDTATGSIVKVTLTKSTTITRNADAAAIDLRPGDTVTVQGATGSSGAVTATSVSATAPGRQLGLRRLRRPGQRTRRRGTAPAPAAQARTRPRHPPCSAADKEQYMKRTTARGLAVLGAAVLVAIALAACGGGGSTTTTTTSSTAATNAADTQGATGATGRRRARRRTALAACLKKYGVTLPSFARAPARAGAASASARPARADAASPFGATGASGRRFPFGATGSQRALPAASPARRLRRQPEARAGAAEVRRLRRASAAASAPPGAPGLQLQQPDPHGADELRRVHEEARRDTADPQPERGRQRLRQRQPDDRELQGGLRAVQGDRHLPEPPARPDGRHGLGEEPHGEFGTAWDAGRVPCGAPRPRGAAIAGRDRAGAAPPPSPPVRHGAATRPPARGVLAQRSAADGARRGRPRARRAGPVARAASPPTRIPTPLQRRAARRRRTPGEDRDRRDSRAQRGLDVPGRVPDHRCRFLAELLERSMHEVGLRLGLLDVGGGGPAVDEVTGVEEVDVEVDLTVLRGAGEDDGLGPARASR